VHRPKSQNRPNVGKLSYIAQVEEGTVRAGPLKHLPPLLSEFGLELPPLLGAVGLAPRSLSHPESVIRIEKVAELLALCAQRSRCTHFGLLLGQRIVPADFGPAGLLMMHADSVGAAWRGLILALHLNGRAIVPWLTVREDTALLTINFYGGSVEGYRETIDLAVASACRATRTLCGEAWSPTEVQLSHRAPPDSGPYRRFFRCPVHFGAPKSSMQFPSSWLAHRIPTADAATRVALEQGLSALLHQNDLDLATKVRRALFALIGQHNVSIDPVAHLLGLHKRTLNRRLSDLGFTFPQLLAEVRFDVAAQLLANTDQSLVDIAAALNYTDASTFSRAFRSWTGVSPSTWRNRQTTNARRRA
jgi:AraC-like DNA-binding protein